MLLFHYSQREYSPSETKEGETLKRKLILLAIASVVTLFFSGCATTQLQTQAKMTRTISLAPHVLEDKQVLLRVTGTEASVLELEAPLRQALKERGVTLVDKEDEAKIALHVNTLFANNLKEAANYSNAVGVGIVGGALSKASGNSSGDSILVGVGVALAMGIADRALADETYRAIIDISLRAKDKEAQTWLDEEKTRVIVEAVRMGLNVEEAKPIMEEKAIYQIAEILK